MTDPTFGSEADVAEQRIPAYGEVPTVDTDHLNDRAGDDATPQDLIDQAIEIPFDDEDRDA